MLPDIGVLRCKSTDCWFRKRSLRRSEFHTAFSASCGSSVGNQRLSPHADIWGLPKPQRDGSSVPRTSIANCSTRPTSQISDKRESHGISCPAPSRASRPQNMPRRRANIICDVLQGIARRVSRSFLHRGGGHGLILSCSSENQRRQTPGCGGANGRRVSRGRFSNIIYFSDLRKTAKRSEGY